MARSIAINYWKYENCGEFSPPTKQLQGASGWPAKPLPASPAARAVSGRDRGERFLECRDWTLDSRVGQRTLMRDDYLQAARKVIDDPNILINVISRRVKQFKRGSRPLVVSLEKLAPEDIALREVIEGKITYAMPTAEELAAR